MALNRPRAVRSDVLLILDRDPTSNLALHQVATALGCDVIQADNIESLRTILMVRLPTVIAFSIDHSIGNDAEVMDIVAALRDRPATLLVGSVRPRVLASAARVAKARGVRIIGTAQRQLEITAITRLLAPHLRTIAPIEKPELEHALAEFELTLQYQPRVEIGTDTPRIQAVEALVRWNHPRRGVLYPAAFLGGVEEHGLMTQLTDYVLTEALRQTGQWSARGLVPAMIVNLNPSLVRDRGFPERLAMLLRENAVPPQQLSLDVTESAESADRDLVLEVFTRLRILGVGLCLDNFGSGRSSLTDLYRMPFSEIKIDHSLIVDAVREMEAELIVRALADLAHTLNLKVCAAGVETSEIYEYVRSVAFDTAQGNYFSAPLEASEVESLMRSWPRAETRATDRWRIRSGLASDGLVKDKAAVGEDPHGSGKDQ